MSSAQRAKAFLRRHGLSAAALDPAAVQASLPSEMAAGLSRQTSALAMLPTYVTIDRPVPADTPAAMMDTDGTILRVPAEHDVTESAFQAHTHHPMVDGTNRTIGGKQACAQPRPKALGLDYCNAGVTLPAVVNEPLDQAKTMAGFRHGLRVPRRRQHLLQDRGDAVDQAHRGEAEERGGLRTPPQQQDVPTAGGDPVQSGREVHQDRHRVGLARPVPMLEGQPGTVTEARP